jgi:hypothetical protein
MKRIKLTESQIHKIVTDATKKVIKESCLYIDTEPFENIMKACNEIMDKYNYTNNEDWVPDDDCDGRDLSGDAYDWAKRTFDEAESWLHSCSSNMPINGGED